MFWYMTWASNETLSTTISTGYLVMIWALSTLDFFTHQKVLSSQIGKAAAVGFVLCFVSNILVGVKLPLLGFSFGFSVATVTTGAFLAIFFWFAFRT
jgi:hypothetical protein